MTKEEAKDYALRQAGIDFESGDISIAKEYQNIIDNIEEEYED